MASVLVTLAVLSFTDRLASFAIAVRAGILDMYFEYGYLLSLLNRNNPPLYEMG